MGDFTTYKMPQNDRVEATEDGVDKCGNPMYRVKNAPSKAGRRCKDGSRRVQAFDFRPYDK